MLATVTYYTRKHGTTTSDHESASHLHCKQLIDFYGSEPLIWQNHRNSLSDNIHGHPWMTVLSK